jgi:Domain of unknown function (DUF1854)
LADRCIAVLENEMNGTSSATSTPLADAGQVRYLDSKKLRFAKHGACLRLTLEDEISYLDVEVIRLFPLSDPDCYLAVCDKDNEEIGILARLSVDVENRNLILERLERRYLMPTIKRVINVEERFGTAEWEVETSRGKRKFKMRNLRENIEQVTPDRCLLSDVDGNRYDVHDLRELDSQVEASFCGIFKLRWFQRASLAICVFVLLCDLRDMLQ